MKNYIEIEKYKIDPNTQELIKVDAGEGLETIKKENSLNLHLREYLINTYSPLLDVNYVSSDLSSPVSGFKNFTMWVSAQKLLTKNPYFNDGTVTYDTTSTDPLLFIKGETIVGDEVTTEVGSDIRTVTFKQRFNPPSTGTRTINTIRVGNNITSFRHAFNNILLDSPCYQESNEILIITYRYQYNYAKLLETVPYRDNLTVNKDYVLDVNVKHLGYCVAKDYNNLQGRPYMFKCSTGRVNNAGLLIVPTASTSYRNTSNSIGVQPIRFLGYPHKHQGFSYINGSFTTGTYNGKLISSIIGAPQYHVYTPNIPNSSSSYIPNVEIPLRNPLDSAIQNSYFKQQSGDVYSYKPFYDLNNLAVSLGNVSVVDTFESGDTSFKHIPHLSTVVRTEIVQGGANEQATYKISARYFSNFATVNNYRPSASSSVLHFQSTLTDTKYLYTDFKIKEGELKDINLLTNYNCILPLQLGEVLAFYPYAPDHQEYGLWVHSLDPKDTDFPIRLNASTVTGFNATDIRGVTTAEDGTILVACANTGLWRLKRNLKESAAATTVQRIGNTGALDDTKCHAVNFIRLNHRFESTGRIAAMFGNQLLMSEDGGATWSVYDDTTNPRFSFNKDPDDILGINGNLNENSIVVVYKTTTTPLSYLNVENSGSYRQYEMFFWYLDESDINTSSSYIYIRYTSNNNIYDGFGCYMRNSGNFMARPTLKNTHPYLIKEQESYTYTSLYSPKTGNIVRLPNVSYSTHKAFPLFDSTLENETYILYKPDNYLEGNSYNLVMDSVTDLLNGTQKYSIVVKNSYNELAIVAGRGLLLSTGRVGDTASDEIGTHSGDCLSYFHVGAGNDDFYKNNHMNFWYNYTYDIGSNTWKLSEDFNSVNAKTTHTTEDSCILGLKNSFSDDPTYVGNASNFLSGEFCDTYVADGILKDDFTSMDFTSFVFYGISKEGNTFTPSVVPANPLGNVTENYSISYVKTWENTGNATYSGSQAIMFESDYINAHGYITSDSSTIFGNNYATVGEMLVSDFELSFNPVIDATSSFNSYTQYAGSRRDYPQFGFVDANALSGISDAPYVWGMRVSNKDNTGLIKIVTVFDGTNYTYVDLPDIDPNVDKFVIKRVNNNIELYINTTLLSTVAITTENLQGLYRVTPYNVSGSMNSNAYYFFTLGLANARITYTSNTLKAKIGDSTSGSGVFDPDFGYMHTEEFINGNKKIYLNGVEATIILSTDLTPPPAGSIKLCIGSGELIFSPADAGKVITGNWRMIPSVNSKGAN